MPDYVHMMISIPPEYAVSEVVGYIKGKSAIHRARVYGERK
jgi:putative transposase